MKPPTIVAHVVLNLNVGGLERVVINLARGFQDSDYRAIVCCLEEPGELAGELAAVGCPVFVIGKRPGIDFRTNVRLSRVFRRERVQIAHTHNAAPHLSGLFAARLAGVPLLVHTKHGRDRPTWRTAMRNRVLSWGTDAIVAVSEDARQVVLERERVDPRKVSCILNGVDVTLYQARGNELPRAPTIGTVGRLAPEKDQQAMLEAFALVLAEMPDARLVMAGSGPCEAELHQAAARLGITASVDFLGLSRDVPAVLRTLSVFTLSSITEGLSLTLIEALAAGVPVVATDVGGNREIIDPPNCGIVVPVSDPQALAQGYLELLRDPVRRAAMGAAGRARASTHFGVEKMVAEYRALYDALLGRAARH